MVTHRQTDRQTNMQHTDPAQQTLLGWVEIKIYDINIEWDASLLALHVGLFYCTIETSNYQFPCPAVSAD